MTARAPLTITTTTHAMATTIYWSQVAISLVFVTGAQQALAMAGYVGERITGAWALILGGAALVAALAAHTAPSRAMPTQVLRVELWACLVLGLASLAYEVALFASNGFTVLVTQIYAVAIGVGALRRVWQIRSETRSVRAALAHPHSADPSPLAEPLDADGE